MAIFLSSGHWPHHTIHAIWSEMAYLHSFYQEFVHNSIPSQWKIPKLKKKCKSESFPHGDIRGPQEFLYSGRKRRRLHFWLKILSKSTIAMHCVLFKFLQYSYEFYRPKKILTFQTMQYVKNMRLYLLTYVLT